MECSDDAKVNEIIEWDATCLQVGNAVSLLNIYCGRMLVQVLVLLASLQIVWLFETYIVYTFSFLHEVLSTILFFTTVQVDAVFPVEAAKILM